jgi:hypothetical protein
MLIISMPILEVEVISETAIPLGISDWALGIIVALIFGVIIFIAKCGKQCCDSIVWIIEILKMNIGKGAGEKEQRSDVVSSIEEFSRKEIAEIKEQIFSSSQQIKAILAEVKQIRKTEVLKALEDDIKLASTEYAMKFELKKSEFEKAIKILKALLAEIPKEDVADKQKVIKWIAKAQEKFDKYDPENFVQTIDAVKARRRAAQNKQLRGNEAPSND